MPYRASEPPSVRRLARRRPFKAARATAWTSPAVRTAEAPPQTGDGASPMLWLGLCLPALGGMAALWRGKRGWTRG